MEGFEESMGKTVMADTTAIQSTVLQQVVFPHASALDAAALYVDTGEALTLRPPPKDPSVRKSKDVLVSLTQAGGDAHLEDFLSRRSIVVRAGNRISFASIFNAFPASYWRRWTSVGDVTLRVRTTGTGSLLLMKSTARGALQLLKTHRLEGEAETVLEVSLASFGDGGWLWFDLVAGEDDLVLEGAEWVADTAPLERPRVVVQVTTMDKPGFCVGLLQQLADPEVLALLDQVLIVDQGRSKVADHDGFSEAAAGLEGKLRIIEQANLGGSGGFARGMYEALQHDFDYVLLMDDDIELEPESVARLIAFSQLTDKPSVVGGLMFDLYDRSTLHTMGESITPWRFDVTVANEVIQKEHDLASANLRQTPWMHRRFDVDYNGWWMCLVPTEIIREVGLSLPLFIKWDDAEYGIRSKERGFPTITLPGTGVWHVSWGDKDDLVGWQAYFHARNRVIVALLHSPYEHGGRIPRELFLHTVRHLLTLQYGTGSVRNLAIADVLDGPMNLPGLLATRLPDVRAELEKHSDTVMERDIDAFPAPGMLKPPRRGRGFRQPHRALLGPWAIKNFVRQNFASVDEEQNARPQAHLPHQDNLWWRVSQYDSAIISNAEGTAVSWYKRDPQKLRASLSESALLHRRLRSEWRELAQRYRESRDELTSPESWGKIFAEHTKSDTRY